MLHGVGATTSHQQAWLHSSGQCSHSRHCRPEILTACTSTPINVLQPGLLCLSEMFGDRKQMADQHRRGWKASCSRTSGLTCKSSAAINQLLRSEPLVSGGSALPPAFRAGDGSPKPMRPWCHSSPTQSQCLPDASLAFVTLKAHACGAAALSWHRSYSYGSE